ncbi:MAG: PQQ-dependent sugar dehydrogenase [Planctomycetota bacterium]|nr:PQQ-dependent sugar dehydrogenase [Planctomycetota bacterium]
MKILRITLMLSLLSLVMNSAAAQTKLKLEQVGGNFSKPLLVTSAPGETNRMFVVDQNGKIFVVKNGVQLNTPFLDVSAINSSGGERGLLGLAFHPQYASNGYFFINFTDNSGDTQVSRYQASAGNPDVANSSSRSDILFIDQPYSNHNGGCIRFGPDGYLYIATGDGGSANDPGNRAQNGSSLLGKMLRIDVDGASPYAIPPSNPFVTNSSVRDEIWALGLRNPWRFNFDSATGDMYISDVGQNEWEYIHFEPAGDAGGRNYGWKIIEGSHCFSPSNNCNTAGLEMPIFEYGHSFWPTANYCIIGSEVYRGKAMARMSGRYFFSDAGSQDLLSFRYNSTTNTVSDYVDHTAETNVSGSASSLGMDGNGEVYVCRTPNIYKIVPAEMRLLVPSLNTGTQAVIYVTVSSPNSPTYLAYSFQGLGNTPVSQLSVVLSLSSPQLAATATSDAGGIASYSVVPPPRLFGRTIWLQAAQQGKTSNVFEATFN